jgi:hypothetical protein
MSHVNRSAARSLRQFTAMILVAVASMMLGQLTAGAATLPYSEGFEAATVGNDAPAGFSESADDAWSVVDSDPITGTKSYATDTVGQASQTVTNRTMFQVPELGGPAATAKDFIYTVVFRFDSGTTIGSGSINLALLALTDANGSNGYTGRLLGSAAARIFDGGSPISGGDVDQGAFSIGEDYTVTLTGTYNASDELELYLFVNGTGITGTGVSGTDVSPSANSYFGISVSAGSSATTIRSVHASFDDLSILVPEPASIAMVGLGVLAVVRRRR